MTCFFLGFVLLDIPSFTYLAQVISEMHTLLL